MISKDKKYKTHNGEEVRIYATDGASESVHGAIFYDGQWFSYNWSKDGRGSSRKRDLIEVKPRIKIKAYLLLFKDDYVSVYTEKHIALREMYASKKWNTFKAATEIEIDCEEGQELHE
jgi:hypothetical protein